MPSGFKNERRFQVKKIAVFAIVFFTITCAGYQKENVVTLHYDIWGCCSYKIGFNGSRISVLELVGNASTMRNLNSAEISELQKMLGLVHLDSLRNEYWCDTVYRCGTDRDVRTLEFDLRGRKKAVRIDMSPNSETPEILRRLSNSLLLAGKV
jgi:hypothetical protein